MLTRRSDWGSVRRSNLNVALYAAVVAANLAGVAGAQTQPADVAGAQTQPAGIAGNQVQPAGVAGNQAQPAAVAGNQTQPTTGFLRRIYRDAAGEHKYTVFIPAAYRADQKWPVLLYLHGAGSRGTDGRLPLIGGIGPQVEARAQTLPLIVVFPQCEDVEGRAA